MNTVKFIVSFLTLSLFSSFRTVAQEKVKSPSDVSGEAGYGIQALREFNKLPYLRTNAVAMQESSHDPAGLNNDGAGGHFRYTFNGENVMADIKGPGVVYHLWLTGYAPTDRIKFYFDDESTPRINETVSDFFSGIKPPFLSPLCLNEDASSGGFVCYLPFPFQKTLRITTTGDGYYNVTYQKLEPGIEVVSWNGKENIDDVLEMFRRRGVDPKSTANYSSQNVTANISKGGVTTLFNLANGPQMVGQLLLKIPELVFVDPPAPVTDDGRAHKGFSEFVVKINPAMQPVSLVRRLDFGIADQKGRVYVDGTLAGDWFTPGFNATDHWLDSRFSIPEALTQGKSQIKVRVDFVSSALDWNDFFYWIYCGTVKTDSLDVGNTNREIAHSYRINNPTWEGTRRFTYPSTSTPRQEKNSNLLEKVKLRIYWDDEITPSVEAPLGLFFGVGTPDAIRIKALPVGVTENDEFYCYFPMPFANRAIVQLINDSNYDLNNVVATIKYEPFLDSFDKVGHFMAGYSRSFPVTLGQDFSFLKVQGTGHFVGVVLEARGDSAGYLEGDERFYVDDAATPWMYGTGTEDYFNGGWYFYQGPFNLATHGLSNSVSENRCMYRFHLSDVIPFTQNGKFGIEHGGSNEMMADYHSVAFYYLKDKRWAIMSDSVDVGDSASETQHNYSIQSQTAFVTRDYNYEGDDDNRVVRDQGRHHKGTSEFAVSISPANFGVRLLRRFDYGILNQSANVYVDGQLVGIWHSAGSNAYKRWRDEIFMIPAKLTAGKASIKIRIDNTTGAQEWSEFKYWIYSIGDGTPVLAPQAVRFESAGDYIEVSHSIALTPAPITIELWLRVRKAGNPNVAGGEQTILDKRDAGNGYNLRLAGTSFPLGISAVFEPNILFVPNAIESQAWYHIAATQDANTIRLYLNGNLIGSLPNRYAANSSGPLRLGEFLGYPCVYLGLRGDLDEVRIWKIARTESEIRATMYQPLNGNENGLVAYWPFDNDTGITTRDKTANNNHGTLHGNVKFITSNAPIGFVPPPVPVGLRVIGDDKTIHLFWKPSQDQRIGSLAIHRGITPDFVVDSNSMIASVATPDSLYTDQTATAGQNYFYRLQAIDSRSRLSNPGKAALGRLAKIFDDYFTGVYYYPWYGPQGHTWPGQYLRDYLIIKQPPWLGQYSSREPKVIRQHFDWMQQYGIDFLVSSWWGQTSHENLTLRDYILPELSARPLKFTVFYETAILEGGEIDAAKEAKLVSDFIYIANTYFNHPNFLRLDGRPAVFFYISHTLEGNYVQAFNHVRSELQNRGYNLYLIGDEMTWREPSATHLQILDGISSYMMYGLPAHEGYLLDKDFYADISRKAGEWESVCKAEGKVFIPNVHPGFNNRGAGGRNYVAPRQSTAGAAHTSMFEEYIKVMRPFVDPQLKMIMITSWNEWHEDTQIEPTIVTAPTTQDVSGSGFYTQNYSYEGRGLAFLEGTGKLLASRLQTGVEESPPASLPEVFYLAQNYPNPFNPLTTISFSIPSLQHVRLKVYDIRGLEVATLIDGRKIAGQHRIYFNASQLISGLYFYKIQVGSLVTTKKMLFIK